MLLCFYGMTVHVFLPNKRKTLDSLDYKIKSQKLKQSVYLHYIGLHRSTVAIRLESKILAKFEIHFSQILAIRE